MEVADKMYVLMALLERMEEAAVGSTQQFRKFTEQICMDTLKQLDELRKQL